MSPEHHQLNGFHAMGSRRQCHCAAAAAPRHRISEVLQEEGISLRSAAKRMGVAPTQARLEAAPQFDLCLSALYRWHSALRVPIVDLLTPPTTALSPVIGWRANLLKVMRTVRSIELQVEGGAVQRLSRMLANQLTEIMPELSHVSAWPAVGARRTNDELGAIFERQIPEDFFEAAEQ